MQAHRNKLEKGRKAEFERMRSAVEAAGREAVSMGEALRLKRKKRQEVLEEKAKEDMDRTIRRVSMSNKSPFQSRTSGTSTSTSSRISPTNRMKSRQKIVKRGTGRMSIIDQYLPPEETEWEMRERLRKRRERVRQMEKEKKVGYGLE